MQVFLNTKLRIPAILFDFTEKLVATHHLGKTFFVMLQVNEIAIAKLVGPIGQLLGQNMGMAINFEHSAKVRNVLMV